jgi:hypothetical protein
MAKAKKPESRLKVKKSPSAIAPTRAADLALAEAQRSAAIHAARAASASVRCAEQQLESMREVEALIEAVLNRFERRREYLEETVELGRSGLAQALEELRGTALKAENAGAGPLGRDAVVKPWAPGAEVERLAAMAAASSP